MKKSKLTAAKQADLAFKWGSNFEQNELNRLKSLLAEEKHPKLTKTLNLERIKELEQEILKYTQK